MIEQILPNSNKKCYRNFLPKILKSKHALNAKASGSVSISHWLIPESCRDTRQDMEVYQTQTLSVWE
jgi:hypothetical protein